MVTSEFGTKIKNLRLSLNEDRATFGKRFGVSGSAIDHWETRGSKPHRKTMEKVGAFMTNPPKPGEDSASAELLLARAVSKTRGARKYKAKPKSKTKSKSSGSWITEIREGLGLDKHAFGKKVGAHPKTIRFWERGTTEPSPTMRLKLQSFGDKGAQGKHLAYPEDVVKLRQRYGETLQAFGARFNVGGSAIANWEQGHYPIPMRHMDKLLRMIQGLEKSKTEPRKIFVEQEAYLAGLAKAPQPRVAPDKVLSSVQAFKDRRNATLIDDALTHVASEQQLTKPTARALISTFLYLVHDEVPLHTILQQLTGHGGSLNME